MENVLQSKNFRITLLVVALLLIGLNVWYGRRGNPVARHGEVHDNIPRPIPSSGFAFNDTNGKIPGNPAGTEAQMRELYKAVQIFIKRNGRLPCSEASPSLHEDMWQHWKEYGLSQPQEVWKLSFSDDMALSDFGSQQPKGMLIEPWTSVCSRPDGTPIGGAKKTGTRDVLLYTDMYYHHNIRLFSKERMTTQPTGFYLVLWDDGEVSRVPFDQARFAPRAKNALYFPGQAGEPEGITQSYAERQKWLNTGPH